MYCAKCGTSIPEAAEYCPGCGKGIRPQKSNFAWILITVLLAACFGVFALLGYELLKTEPDYADQEIKTESAAPVEAEPVGRETELQKPAEPKETEPQAIEKAPQDTAALIKNAQQKVFTIYAGAGQGSGFLINENGDVLTNAHVVEGYLAISLEDYKGNMFEGTVIGYSNDMDIAVIRVNELAGSSPLPIETESVSRLGDEVIALGSPMGYENTATLGNISGVDRNFVIEPHTYSGVYQISASIAPGSSGGPLLDKGTGEVIAINSARDTLEVTIGFSIPISQVMDTVTEWINNPMSETEINELFYNSTGGYFYQDLKENEYYFEAGDYSDEYGYSDYYWEYEEDEYYDEYEEDWYSEEEYEYEEEGWYSEEEYEYEEEDWYPEEEYEYEEDWYSEEEYEYEEEDWYPEEEYEYEEEDWDSEEEQIEDDKMEKDVQLEETVEKESESSDEVEKEMKKEEGSDSEIESDEEREV